VTDATQDKSSEQHFYDRLFRERKRFDQFQNSIYEDVAAEARRGTTGVRALDIGCGSGVQSVCLIRQGFQVVAADLSREATRVARATAAAAGSTLPVVNTDAEFLPLRNASIDACVCGLLLHHFRTLEVVAAELRRVVRPGGVVVAVDANAHQPFVWLFQNVYHRLLPRPGMTPNQRALWSSEVRVTFGRHGFGEFRFRSMTSELRRDWLGGSFAASLNYRTRAAVLSLSRALLPRIAQGNFLVSTFRRLA